MFRRLTLAILSCGILLRAASAAAPDASPDEGLVECESAGLGVQEKQSDEAVDFRLYAAFQQYYRSQPAGIVTLYRASPGLAKLAALSVLSDQAAQKRNLRDPLAGLSYRQLKRFLPLVESFDFTRQLHSSQVPSFVGMYRALGETGRLRGLYRDFRSPFRPFVSEAWIQGKALFDSVNDGLKQLEATKKASLAFRTLENTKRYFKFAFLGTVNALLIHAGQFPSLFPEFAMLKGTQIEDEDWDLLLAQGEKAFVAQVLAKHPVLKWTHVVTRFLERVTILGSTTAYLAVIGTGIYNGYQERARSVENIRNDPALRVEHPQLWSRADDEIKRAELRALYEETIRSLVESSGAVFDPNAEDYLLKREAFVKESLEGLKKSPQ